MLTLRILLLLLCSLCAMLAQGAAHIPANADEALERLDEALELRDQASERRQATIDSLLLAMSPTPGADRLSSLRQAADMYYGFQTDSALTYYYRGMKEAIALGDVPQAQSFELQYLSLLPVGGAVREGVDAFESLDRSQILPDNLNEYFEAGSRMYFYVMDFYSADSLRRSYGAKALEFTDSLQRRLAPGTPSHTYFSEIHRYMQSQDRHSSAARLAELLDTIAPEAPYYSRIAMMLSHYYKSLGRDDDALRYLAVAAIGDALTGEREEQALLMLGKEMHDRGDTDRAYRYLNLSMENALASGSRNRLLQASLHTPLINEAQYIKDQRRMRFMSVLIVLLAAALFGVAASYARNLRERRKLNRARQRLAEANNIKETYISQFMQLTTLHVERLDEQLRLIARKVKTGQTEDLLNQLNISKMRSEHLHSFYDVFDHAFIRIYPNFITGVNALLQPDKQLAAPPRGKLNTELRILAFMRLGIDDGARIAKFLDVSLNTIYTYRNKVRSAAINRDTFESDLKKIDSID